MGPIELERTYDKRSIKKTSPTFLIDRLWPRGIAKSDLDVDAWVKAVAPSPELRSWFGHRADRFVEFRQQYLAELDANPTPAEPIIQAATVSSIVLLYSAKDDVHNHAVVFRDWLLGDR
ncbi:uncharacterized protein YeaO (DUF488 family) [Williamsia limnetica]|uniref:Uncharacterized protein YeaO (DUF488 family) n=1 Tax=Williamsia limnetica TaxID=882452 RepID=A0A318RFM0_WILLI|nr:DUF488 family protein [Williamsia limnetica]PYE12738.1 uncharacterized protein YeaO (DUF488 family) [Williamsia limnetica]